MAEHIQIPVNVLTSHINKLERAILNIEECIPGNEAFEYTNIKPYVNDLENMMKLMQVLQDYKKFFQADTEILTTVSSSFKEQDKHLSIGYEKNIHQDIQPLS
ncbi:MAG TPA: TIGR04197 family type VII secretion effector [Virgibacillus sp.]|nr:TIGR04197 family type VII secretion effector [Virgibacillus sp.]